MPQPSIRSLARQLRLSAATVSLALRDSPRVVEATKRRVRQAAAKADYRPNPLVRSVMAALRRSSHDGFRGALFAVNYTDEPTAVPLPYHREVLTGAEQRARELGYSLEQCWVGPHHLSLARLNAIIQARGVSGVLVMPFPERRDFSALDWGPLAAVVMDYCVSAPALHTVLPDHPLSVFRALERLAGAGYTRPGLVLTADRDRRIMHRWSAGFGSFSRSRDDTPALPVLSPARLERATFLAWFRAHRPDVILGHAQAEILNWLAEAGVAVPAAVGFVHLNWTLRTAPCAALDLQPALLGAAAVESVVAQVQRHEHGIPANPKTITLAARWVDGPTLRAAAAKARGRGAVADR